MAQIALVHTPHEPIQLPGTNSEDHEHWWPQNDGHKPCQWRPQGRQWRPQRWREMWTKAREFTAGLEKT